MLTIDLKELKKQINALCNSSDITTDEKEGLHNLLGNIHDEVLEKNFVVITTGRENYPNIRKKVQTK